MKPRATSPREAPVLTRNQQLVLDVLERSSAPRSAYAILDELRPQGLRAPLQVYRALDKLCSSQLVHRVESLNAFVACSHGHKAAPGLVVFAICEHCGSTLEAVDEALQKRLFSLLEGRNFRPGSAALEVRGVCENCLASVPDP